MVGAILTLMVTETVMPLLASRRLMTYTHKTASDVSIEASAIAAALVAGPFSGMQSHRGVVVPVTLPSAPIWESIYTHASIPAFDDAAGDTSQCPRIDATLQGLYDRSSATRR